MGSREWIASDPFYPFLVRGVDDADQFVAGPWGHLLADAAQRCGVDVAPVVDATIARAEIAAADAHDAGHRREAEHQIGSARRASSPRWAVYFAAAGVRNAELLDGYAPHDADDAALRAAADCVRGMCPDLAERLAAHAAQCGRP